MRVRLALAAVTLAVFAAAPSATPDDALYELGAIESSTLAGGEGWIVWATRRPHGLLSLRGARDHAIPGGLPVPPFSSIGSVDVGRGPRRGADLGL